MTVLPETFILLTLLGLWRPINWHGWKSLLYNCYTIIVIFLCYSFTLSEFLDLLFITSDIANFASNAAVFLAMVAVCGKIVGILQNRQTLLIIQQSFSENPFKPQDDEDLKIQERCNHFIRLTALAFIGIHEIGGASVSCSRVFADRQSGELPYRAWLPYNYSSSPCIWYLSAAQQIITVFIAGHINAVFDLLYPGIMFLMCAQVNMLKNRFHVMLKHLETGQDPNSDSQILKDFERNLMSEWVQYHLAILRLGEFMHSKFSKIVFIQYSASAIIICTTVYIMSNIPIVSVEFAGNLFYLFGSVFEVFIECISANEATLQFADLNREIYNTNWFALKSNEQKSIVIIMSKTMKPIIFHCGYIIELSLESFKSIMKLSYSIYNVLQQS